MCAAFDGRGSCTAGLQQLGLYCSSAGSIPSSVLSAHLSSSWPAFWSAPVHRETQHRCASVRLATASTARRGSEPRCYMLQCIRHHTQHGISPQAWSEQHCFCPRSHRNRVSWLSLQLAHLECFLTDPMISCQLGVTTQIQLQIWRSPHCALSDPTRALPRAR